MDIKVIECDSDNECTISKVYINEVFQCYSIEDEKRDVKVKGETRIPAGIYVLGLRWSPKFSPKFNHKMLWVLNVPGFEYILIHWGNTDLDTDGCLVLGKTVGALKKRKAVLNSVAAYEEFYPKVIAAMNRGEKVTIQYIRKN